MKNASHHLLINKYEEKLFSIIQDIRGNEGQLMLNKQMTELSQFLTDQFPKYPANEIATKSKVRQSMFPESTFYKEFLFSVQIPLIIPLNDINRIAESIHQILISDPEYISALKENITDVGIGVLLYKSHHLIISIIFAEINHKSLQEKTQSFCNSLISNKISTEWLLQIMNQFRDYFNLTQFVINQSLSEKAEILYLLRNTNPRNFPPLIRNFVGEFVPISIVNNSNAISALFDSQGFVDICLSFLTDINFYIQKSDEVTTIIIVVTEGPNPNFVVSYPLIPEKPPSEKPQSENDVKLHL